MEFFTKFQLLAGAITLLGAAASGWELHSQIGAPMFAKCLTLRDEQARHDMAAARVNEEGEASWQRWPRLTDF